MYETSVRIDKKYVGDLCKEHKLFFIIKSLFIIKNRIFKFLLYKRETNMYRRGM